MKKGKIIVVEGTDCSGKETQAKLLASRLSEEGEKTYYFGFPNYDSPTGKIVGLSYLGKSYLADEMINKYRDDVTAKVKKACEERGDSFSSTIVNQVFDELIKDFSVGWFPEGAANVEAKVASALFTLDRSYNISSVQKLLESGNVVMDRYVYSNMGHQGGKISSKEERDAFYDWISYLEYNMFNLPREDIRVFLHVPAIYTEEIKKQREEALDEHERDFSHLQNAEDAYLELIRKFGFEVINCLKQQSDPISISDIKTREDIHEDVYNKVKKLLKNG